MQIQQLKPEILKPYVKNARKITQKAIDKVITSLQAYGWQQPIVVDADMVVLAGHARLLAAKQLCMATVPVVIADHLTPDQARGYRLMDPDVVSVVRKWKRWQHQVDYSKFRGNRLIPKPGFVAPSESDNYGMEIVDYAPR